jgi:hypothetical protein
MHQINNRQWFFPAIHTATQGKTSADVSEVFKFDENSLTFKITDSNKIYLL